MGPPPAAKGCRSGACDRRCGPIPCESVNADIKRPIPRALNLNAAGSRFSKLATPNHIGKPIIPLPGTEKGWRPAAGWDGKCWTNDTASWGLFAGAVDYNTKNPCCLRYNGGGTSWARLEFTWQGQVCGGGGGGHGFFLSGW